VGRDLAPTSTEPVRPGQMAWRKRRP
jgi:hypothetical protein